jgi:hypothetical protein
MGSAPPEESIRISDQIGPVEIWTEATLLMAMLSSVRPKKRGFTRVTCWGLTVIRVGKNRLPFVHLLAAKVSSIGIGLLIASQELYGVEFLQAGEIRAFLCSDPPQLMHVPRNLRLPSFPLGSDSRPAMKSAGAGDDRAEAKDAAKAKRYRPSTRKE